MINLPQQGDIVPHSATTQLRLYSGVPWSQDYEHVRLYASKDALLTALEHWRITPSTQISQMTPIHVGELSLKVPFTEMTALNINYLAFQNNTSSSYNEWQFCFVTAVEWVSQNTTRIRFVLDIWQNNIYNVTLKPCFIERAHVAKSDDARFANLMPENFETGEYIEYNRLLTSHGDLKLCLYVSEKKTDTEWQAVQGGVSNNVFMGADLLSYDLDSETLSSDIESLLQDYTDASKIDAVLEMFVAPNECVSQWGLSGAVGTDHYLSIGSPFEGYVPKNNKLYQYPYIYIGGFNNLGEAQIYRWEYFAPSASGDAHFRSQALMATMPTITLNPWDYKGSEGRNFHESMVYNDFPTACWQSDTYRAWMAQNKGYLIQQGINAAIDAGQAIANVGMTGWEMINPLSDGEAQAMNNLVESAQSAFNSVYSIVNEVQRHQALPPTVHGKVMQEAINAGLGYMGFTLKCMSIKSEFAKMIDDFWTVYGYPIKEIQTPNYTSRSSWNYIKTANCNIQGEIELSQRSALKAIFDRGVTVWHTDDIGNYSLENN